MIYVDRRTVKAPKSLSTNGKGGIKETADNIRHAVQNQWNRLKFEAYTKKDVKAALIKLFRGKCAYCESKFLHVYSGDVEHFRPKSQRAEANPTRPGYYWLAADWDNLFLSCRNCNQQLSHEIFGIADLTTAGKMDQFPLLNGHQHVQSHVNHPNAIAVEEDFRLLINPCKEDPEEYFEYDEVHATIKPKNLTGKKRQMALETIDVCVLQRVPLVQAREIVLIDIFAQIQRVLEASINLNNSLGSDPKMTFVFDKVLRRELTRLKKFTLEDQEYSGMARQIVGNFMQNFNQPAP